MGKAIKLIKNRSDIGAGTRGSDLGIDAIEIAAINNNSDYFNQFEFEDVKTHNDSIYDKNRSSFAKRIEHVVEQCTRVCDAVKENLEGNYFPIVLSGDHSSALGTLSGVKAAYPEQNIGYKGPKVLAENLIYFGVRDTEEEEDKQIEKLHIKNYKVDEVRYRGLKTCIEEALLKLTHCEVLYISFDVDAMDCDMISDGTGTPVPKGFDQYEIIAIINQIVKTKKVVCIEFVEVNPLLDTKGNKMAETAFEILEAITSALILPIK